MPTPPTPMPPTLPRAEDLIINNQPNQEQVQYVTPGVNETNNRLNQTSNSTSNSNGSASAVSAPNISGTSANINTQVNSGYGDHTEECMENVGCQSTMHLDMVAYYGGSDIRSNVDNWSRSNSDFNNYGAAFRLVIPLGGGFDGQLDQLAIEEVKKRQAEQILLNQAILARNAELDRDTMQHCINLKNPTGGKRIVLVEGPDSGALANRNAALCRGIEVAMDNKNDDIAMLLDEVNRLQQKIAQLTNRGKPQTVGN